MVLERVSVMTFVDCAAAAAEENLMLGRDVVGAAESDATLFCAAPVLAGSRVVLIAEDEAAPIARPPLDGATALAEACSGYPDWGSGFT